jgi:hypothetical protein
MSVYKCQATARAMILKLSFKVLTVMLETFIFSMITNDFYFAQDFASHIWLFNKSTVC